MTKLWAFGDFVWPSEHALPSSLEPVRIINTSVSHAPSSVISTVILEWSLKTPLGDLLSHLQYNIGPRYVNEVLKLKLFVYFYKINIYLWIYKPDYHIWEPSKQYMYILWLNKQLPFDLQKNEYN